jgi:hypothetical protein
MDDDLAAAEIQLQRARREIARLQEAGTETRACHAT